MVASGAAGETVASQARAGRGVALAAEVAAVGLEALLAVPTAECLAGMMEGSEAG